MLEQVGPFKILERLGWSSLGDVYRGRDPHGRTVAVKVVPAAITSSPERRARFLEDAHRAAQVSHPNIAELYQVAEDEDRVYLVYEFVLGESLHTVMSGQPLNPRRAIGIAVEIADALAEAHAAHVAHGGLTAESIALTPKGRAKVLDLGLVAWSAPSGAGVAAPRDAASARDVEALGTLLFEMVTGALPRPGAEIPSRVNPSVPPEINPIVAKARDLSRGEPSAAALAADLRALADLLDSRRPAVVPAPRAPVPQPSLRGSIAVWAAAAFIVLAAAALLWYVRHAR